MGKLLSMKRKSSQGSDSQRKLELEDSRDRVIAEETEELQNKGLVDVISSMGIPTNIFKLKTEE